MFGSCHLRTSLIGIVWYSNVGNIDVYTYTHKHNIVIRAKNTYFIWIIYSGRSRKRAHTHLQHTHSNISTRMRKYTKAQCKQSKNNKSICFRCKYIFIYLLQYWPTYGSYTNKGILYIKVYMVKQRTWRCCGRMWHSTCQFINVFLTTRTR